MAYNPDIAATQELLAQTQRLGLAPVYRRGTVLANSSSAPVVMVTLDNDTDPVPCFNYAGPLFTNERVLVQGIKPHGLYVLGRSGLGGAKQQIYSLLTQSNTDVPLVAATTTIGGTAQTVTVNMTHQYVATICVDYMKVGVGATTTGVAQAYLDGVACGTQRARYRVASATTTDNATITQTYTGSAAAGTHTWDIRAMRISGGDGNLQTDMQDTTLLLEIYV
jgi:hypothetical protein